MEKLNPSDFKKTSVDTNELLQRIGTGGAILFVGSGYSRGSLSVRGDELPIAEGLANAIGELGGFDADKDLRYASERFMREKDPAKLVDMLVERFSVKAASEHHVEISTAKWRRIYTTNYDLMIERAAESKGLVLKPVDIDSSVRENARNHNICVHLNGSIRSLGVESLDTTFKLTTSSYLSPISFLTSPWHFIFKKDLELASAIVFVGYSLYDIEVQRILYEMPEFREKTYFVTHEGESERQKYTLGLYGNVLTMGAQGFGELLKKELPRFSARTAGEVFSLERYVPEVMPESPRDSDVDKMLMFGSIPDQFIDASLDKSGAPIVVNRDAMSDARRILATKNLAVVSDFGNGKTIFLRMLKSALAQEGGDIYTVGPSDPAQFGDMEILASNSGKSIVVIDDYEQHLDLIRACASLSAPNVRLVLSARTNTHERHRQALIDAGLDYAEVAIDQLSKPEIDSLIDIFDNAGLWGDLASLDHPRKVSAIAEGNRGQLSLTLLGVLESPQMRERVSGIVAPLLANSKFKDTIFAVSLLQSLAAPLTASLISDVALNDAIFSPNLRSDEGFNQIFRIENGRVSTKSSLFAISMLRNQFRGTYIVDRLLEVITSFVGRDVAPEKERIFKELLRFSNVERLLPDGPTKKANLLRYYEELKRRADWLKRDPHFWLQYAMTQMQYQDYVKAQTFLDQAYALARSKHNYHTIQIDTQQARMWLEQSVASLVEGSSEAYSYFEKANSMLRSVPNDMHKFWQLSRYQAVFERQYDRFNKGQKVNFEQATKNAAADIGRAISSKDLPLHFIGRAETIKSSLDGVVRRIVAGRGAK